MPEGYHSGIKLKRHSVPRECLLNQEDLERVKSRGPRETPIKGQSQIVLSLICVHFSHDDDGH